MLRKAIYPGSFDPMTNGHVDIIRRIHGHYDELVVLVANSPQKSYLFSSEERRILVRECLQDVNNVVIDEFDGLTVDYAKQVGAQVIIRGLRAVSDFEYEMAMANINRKLCPEVETVIVFASPEVGFISSRMVKEVALHGGGLSKLVPGFIEQALNSKLKK